MLGGIPMKNLRRLSLMLLSALLFISMTFPVLAGANAEKKITIDFMWENVTDSSVEIWNKYVFEPFEAEHPNVKINFMPTPDWQTVVQAQLASGSGPDIFLIEPFDVPAFTKGGQIMPLDAYAEKYNWRDRIFDWALDSTSVDGKLMTLPHSYETTMLWYNKDLLDQYNWPVPKTRTEFELVCSKAKEEGLLPIVYGTKGGISNNMWVISDYMSSYCGAEALNKLYAGELKFTDEPIRGAFQQYYDDWKNGWFTDQKSASIDYDTMCQIWQSGEGVFIPQGSWYAYAILAGDIPFDFGVTEWPSMRDGVSATQPVGIGATFGINKNSDCPDECAAFLDSLYMPERAAQGVVNGLQALPIEIDSSLYPANLNPDYLSVLELMSSVEDKGTLGYTVWTFCPGNTTSYLFNNIDKLFYDQITLDEYLKGAQAEMDKDFASGWKSPMK